jgi:hypothetical protein
MEICFEGEVVFALRSLCMAQKTPEEYASRSVGDVLIFPFRKRVCSVVDHVLFPFRVLFYVLFIVVYYGFILKNFELWTNISLDDLEQDLF